MLSASRSISNVRAFAPAPRVAKRTARGPVKVRLRVDARASDATARRDEDAMTGGGSDATRAYRRDDD
jgi:hypothetical protein|tara:strand:+ start:23543 stop:23746 length:204 start_codon:yes stop_codon:yes gene_type:complete